jgi:hypothetical protein
MDNRDILVSVSGWERHHPGAVWESLGMLRYQADTMTMFRPWGTLLV